MKKISLKIIFTVLIFIFTTSIATNSYSATSCTNNDWISALVAQNQPPNNIEIYVKQIHALAPNLKQISLFVTLNDITNISAYDNLLTQYAQLINLLRQTYGNSLIIGFLPDNSKGSIKAPHKGDVPIWWYPINKTTKSALCTTSSCGFNASIILMNNINAQYKSDKFSGTGFNEFAIQQSDFESQTPGASGGIRKEKACLDNNSTGSCPTGITLANPTVKYGYLAPSYSRNLYGTDYFDDGFPQYYHLKATAYTYSAGSTNPFPSQSTGVLVPGEYDVADVYMVSKIKGRKFLPLNISIGGSIYSQGSPTEAADYLTYIFKKNNETYPLNPNPSNASIYIMLSGEANFLGGKNWNVTKLCQFHQDLAKNLLDDGGSAINISNTKFAIWDFAGMLNSRYLEAPKSS